MPLQANCSLLDLVLGDRLDLHEKTLIIKLLLLGVATLFNVLLGVHGQVGDIVIVFILGRWSNAR